MASKLELYKGDCLEVMDRLIEQGVKVDAIITDPPYGTTACKWDIVIPFDKMWEKINKLIKPNGAICLFGSEPFSSALRMSNIKGYKYDWIYQKNKSTGFLNAKRQPLNDNELISVFYNKQCLYNPQKTKADKVYKRGLVNRNKSECYGKERDFFQNDDGMRYPKRIIYFNNNDNKNQLHPTMKPVALIEYLIKTYTNENETVLDFTFGSCTTGIACLNTNRNFIGIELDDKYFDISVNRIKENLKENDELIIHE